MDVPGSPNPLLVEIIAHTPTAFYHCAHCEIAWQPAGIADHLHNDQLSSSLPSDLAAQYQVIAGWVQDLFRRYGGRVVIKVIDAASPEGFLKSLRYGVRRYPAVVVDRKARFTGDALASAEAEIARRLALTLTPPI